MKCGEWVLTRSWVRTEWPALRSLARWLTHLAKGTLGSGS